VKKLVSFFLWFCAATFLAQICIIGLAAFKGNVDRNTISQVIGLLNGIDIQGERLKKALISSRAVPTPTYQDVLEQKTDALLQLDSRSLSLENYKRQLDDRQRELQKQIKDFDQRRTDYLAANDKSQKNAKAELLREVQIIVESLAPEEAKAQLSLKLEKGEKGDVVAIIRGMAADKKKKILGEFTSKEDQEKLSEILSEIQRIDEKAPDIAGATPGKP